MTNDSLPSSDVIFEYTKDFYKLVSDDLHKLGVKNYTLLGFNGVLLRFTQSLPGSENLPQDLACYSCLALKTVCCGLALISIVFCIKGFLSGEAGTLPDPSDLVKSKDPRFPYGWGGIDPSETKMNLAKAISQTLDEFDKKREEKSKTLNVAIYCFAAASCTFGLDIILDTMLRGLN